MHQARTRWPAAQALAAAALAVLSTEAAAGGDLSLELGAEYTRGDYGTGRDTRIGYVPLTLRYDADLWALSATIPYVIVRGPGNVVPGIGGAPRASMGSMHVQRSPAAAAATRSESGLGDVVLSGSVRLAAERDSRPRLDLTGKIKLATADEDDNLGTGENDFAVQLEFDKDIFYGYAGYKVYGDPPGLDLDNVFYGLFGVSAPLRPETRAGVSLYAEQAAVAGTDGQLELAVFLSRRFDRRTRLRPYVVVGLSDGSPDWGVGITLTLER